MDGAAASLFHLRGGIILANKLTIGGFFNTSINEIMPQSETVPAIYMDYWSAGGYVEYTLFSDKLIHITFPLYIGAGEVQMDRQDDSGWDEYGESNFLVIEPSVLLEVNLHKYARLNIGAGYRTVGTMTYRNLDQSALSGLTGYVGIKFGLFR